jgi:hypothetical protein
MSAGATLQNRNRTMRRFLLSLLVLSPLSLATPAHADYWNWNYQQVGNYGNGRLTGPNSYSGSYQQNRIGNFVNSSYQSPYGTTRCTTSYIGSFAQTSCY